MTPKLTLIAIVLLGAATNLMAAEDDYAAGKEIFESRCDLCHQAPVPQQLRPKQWQVVLSTMQKRMAGAGMTPLSEQQLKQLLTYLAAER